MTQGRHAPVAALGVALLVAAALAGALAWPARRTAAQPLSGADRFELDEPSAAASGRAK